MSFRKHTALVLMALACVIPASVFAVTKTVVKPTLTIEVKQFEVENDPIVAGGSPRGHVVLFGGWMDMRLLVTHADGMKNQKLMPLMQGKEVGRKGYYYAGTQDDLVFVRSGSSLQVQRETRDEMSTAPSPREPLFTMYLPTSISLKLK